MKKAIFLLSVIIGFVSISQAQFSKESYRKYMKKPVEPSQTNADFQKKDIKFPSNHEKSVNNDVERLIIGKSPNAYSILHSEQRPLFYCESSIQYVFEADPNTYDEVLENGNLMSTYSEMEGIEQPSFGYWEESLLIDNKKISKPSAVLIRPEESNNIDDYYSIISAQDTIEGSWSNTTFASSQINNDNYQESIYNWESDNDWARSSMTTYGDEVYIFGQDFENIGSYGKNQVLKHYRGLSENLENGFDWEINAVSPDWLIDPEEGFAYALYTTWSAWSEDESIGYMWMIGVSNDSYEYGVYQPQVFYTTDKGDSWNEIELNLENHQALVEYLQPWIDENGNPGTVRPSFISADNNFPGAVDVSGRLHLFSNVYGSTKGDVLNPADSNWIDPDALGGHIFDFIINMEGIDEIKYVGDFKTRVSTNVFGNIGLNHRLQVGKTSHNSYADIIGAIWVDDVLSGSDSLVNPDLFAWNMCGGFASVGPTNITEGDLYEGFTFFPTLSENLIFHESYGWRIEFPITVSVRPGEFANSGPSEPITHFFLKNVVMETNWECWWNVKEYDPNKSHFTISQNTPNPFSRKTKIEIVSSFQEPKEIFLEITDLSGHVVYQSSEGKIRDRKELFLNAKDLRKGVYFYTICVGEECLTKKMLVE